MEEKTPYIKEFYTLEQLANELNFNIQSIRKFVKNGDLKVSVIGNRYVTTRENVIEWLNKNKQN